MMQTLPAIFLRPLTRAFILLTLLAISLTLEAQSLDSISPAGRHKSEWFVEGGRETGLIFNPAYVSAANLPAKFEGFDLKIGKHTSGSKLWQQQYRRPIIGAGITQDYAWRPHQYGSYTAAYVFFMAPVIFSPSSRLQTHYLIGYGLAKNWNPSSEPYRLQGDAAHQNIFTSSSIAIYLRFGMEASFRISSHLDALGSLSLSHFSNGSIQAPNPGVSMLNENFGLRYYFNQRLERHSYRIYEERGSGQTSSLVNPAKLYSRAFIPVNDLFASASLSLKQVDTHQSTYLLESVQAGFSHQYAPKFKWGIAGEFFYNPSIAAYYSQPLRQISYFSSGLYAFHEVLINHLALVVGAGLYVKRPEPYLRTYYNRFGYKYYFDKSAISFVSMTINAHALSGNFIEFTTGFRLHRFK